MNTAKSARLYQEAQAQIPGGVNSPARSFKGVGMEYPLFIRRGQGAHIWDADGNEYVDFVGSWGPLILGHAHPRVVEALQKAIRDGTSFGAPTEREVELARLVRQAFPSMEMVRLVSSGTEATMSAVRLARAFTGRTKLVKFAGCYHGHADALLVRAGSGMATHGIPTSAGVPDAYVQETLVAEYNDLASVERLFQAYPQAIAGVIVEPVAGNMGVVPPKPGFLEGLRRLTQEHGALLILDEVITGFRIAYGGAQERYGVHADITCLGKIIGGGLPVGAYGGSREIMAQVAPLGPMYQAGTLSGNPLAVTAGIETLKALQAPGVYAALEEKGARVEAGLTAAAREAGVPLTVNRVGSMLTAFLHPGPVQTWEEVNTSDREQYARFFQSMLRQGMYLAPSQFEAAFLSLAHSSEDLQKAAQAAKLALREVAQRPEPSVRAPST